MSGKDAATSPTLDTILECLNVMRGEMLAGFASMERRFDHLDVRLHRIEADGHDTESKFHSLRADFNELRTQLREHFPVLR